MISTDVFAAIWSSRKSGEDTENDILQRLFAEKQENDKISINSPEIGGYYDSRNNVRFNNGFTVFRIYKGRRYDVEIVNSLWLRKDTGDLYPSLNKLNESIVSGNENVWNGNWKYLDSNDGNVKSINELRP